MVMLALILLVLGCGHQVLSKTLTYNWDITWVTASPDGFARPVIGINGQWPTPTLEATLGDRVIVHVKNQLGNQTTSIHWHGLHQYGNNIMDGSSGVTQCPIPPGSQFTYDFIVDIPGTFWYHAHNSGQYADGLRGPLIVRDPAAPFADKVDGEILFTVSDWYHSPMPVLLNSYQSVQNEDDTDGLEPIPAGPLINDQLNQQITIEPGKTYLVRVIHLGSFVGMAVYFDGHPFTVVEVDGVYTEENYMGDKNFRIAPGQRWSLLITAKPTAEKNYVIFITEDINMFTPPAGYNPNGTAYLVYDEQKALPPQVMIQAFDFFDDMSLIPLDHEPLLDQVDHRIHLETGFAKVNGIHRAVINDVTYLAQKVPSLYTALTVGSQYASNPVVYGVNSNPFILKKNEVVEIVLNNNEDNLHPWHLHGHRFQVIQRTDPETGPFKGYNTSQTSPTPLRRDTIMANKNSNLVIRFRADNPGLWLFHCHVEWHVEAGLSVTIIEAPEELEGTRIPQDHLDTCRRDGMAARGNAAGNTRNPLNLNGSVTVPSTNDQGATFVAPTKSYKYQKRYSGPRHKFVGEDIQ